MKIYQLGLVIVGFVVAVPVFAVFDRNLQLGSIGGDVALLQYVLNRDPSTQVTAFGPGSPGQETTTFGQLTKQAVIRLQEKYRGEVLTPFGLSVGTGFVGPATRRLLERLYQPIDRTPAITTPLQMTVEVPPLPPPIESFPLTISASSVKPVSTTASVGPDCQNNFSSDFVKALKEAGMTKEEYCERNAPPSPYLRIASISPTSGNVGTKVTLAGNFSTSTSQDVYVGPETFKKLKSKDGKTLSVTINNPFPDEVEAFLDKNRDYKKETQIPISIWVRDISGVSNPVFFTLTL